MSFPLILGLSHLFGETADLQRQADFWSQHGFAREFDWRLPVSAEKNRFLLGRNAESVDLRYLKWTGSVGVPGLEFLQHSVSADVKVATETPRPPRLSLFVKSDRTKDVVDPDGNCMATDPRLTTATTAVVTARNVKLAGEFLRVLGFVKSQVHEVEKHVFPKGVHEAEAWKLQHPLFAQLGVRLLLTEAPGNPVPLVDERGLTGLSFLTSNLDLVRRQLSLTGSQSIEGPDWTKEIAFYNRAGILAEFLAVKRRKPL